MNLDCGRMGGLVVTCALTLLVSSGCRNEQVFLGHMSTVTAETNGVAMVDGATSHLGMQGTTCEVDVSMGMVTGDFDLPSKKEKVVDSWSDMVVATSNKGVHVLERRFGPGWDIDIKGAVDAAMSHDGVVAYTDRNGCAVEWENGTKVDAPCGATHMEIERDGTTVFLGGPTGTWIVDDTGDTIDLGHPSTDIAWAEDTGVLLVVQEEQTVSCYDGEGELQWEKAPGGTIMGIDDFDDGRYGAVATDEGLVLMETDDGHIYGVAEDAPTEVEDVVVEGGTVAFVEEDQTSFYDCDTGSVPPPKKAEPIDVFD